MARRSQALPRIPRRDFIIGGTVALGCLLVPDALRAAPGIMPTSSPVTHLKLAWTDSIKWANLVDITQVPGQNLEDKLAAAQAALAAKGGGVVYFPPGVYHFQASIVLRDGVVLRGAPPDTKAHDENYAPPSKLDFPKYEFKAEGDGTPLQTAFKGIHLENPARDSHCGLVDLDINHGHICFAEAENHACGCNRLVWGCRLRNAAVPNKDVPDLNIGQKPWQRYTATWDRSAIQVWSAENALIANNRLPKSGDDNFTMNGFLMQDRKRQLISLDGVVFDYDNRAGIYLNHYGIGGPGGQGPDGTPESHPYGFRKGLVIRDNYVFNSGRCAIGFCGEGVEVRNNLIRFAKDVWRPTVTGRHQSHGASTNDNRALEMRGWRWIVDGNDFQVYRNLCADRIYPINDGEGLMHEDHVNSTVQESVLTNNRGNAYISIYQVAGIDGLLIEGNEIRIDPQASGEPAIHVTANRTNQAFPCRNVRIINNIVHHRGILINGSPADGNLVKGNKAIGNTPQVIHNQAKAKVAANEGFTVDETPWMSADDRRKLRERK